MAKQVSTLVLSLMLALADTGQVLGQGRQMGTLRGTVHDQQGLVVPGVSITVLSEALQGTRSIHTGVNGHFDLPGLPPGAYAVTFDIHGLRHRSADGYPAARWNGRGQRDA